MEAGGEMGGEIGGERIQADGGGRSAWAVPFLGVTVLVVLTASLQLTAPTPHDQARLTGADAAPAPQSTAPDPAWPPALQAGHAPSASGVTVTLRELRTNRRGGRITGLSRHGLAVGFEGTGTARRAVRWDGGRAVPLPDGSARQVAPLVSADGVIAYQTGSGPAALVDGVVRRARVPHPSVVAGLGGDGRVLLRREHRGVTTEYLWSPATGSVVTAPAHDVATPAGWRDRYRNLPGLGGKGSEVTGVGSDGTVVGFADAADGVRHAVAWVPNGIVDLGATAGGATESIADGITGSRVYGRVTGSDGVSRPVIWTLHR